MKQPQSLSSPSFEILSWRKQSSASFATQYFSTNQNAIGSYDSDDENKPLSDEKENQSIPNTSSPSTHFTSDNPVELQIDANNKLKKINSELSQKSVIITRRTSKPSRHESIQIATAETRKHQYDRYKNYHYRLKEDQLYSLIVSSEDTKCYGTNCQPSVFNTSYRCRTISSDTDIDTILLPQLMNDQYIKENISYISLTNLSNLIDHEPNVSRRNSYAQSSSNILMHKTSLFLADVFNKMSHEQRTKSIAHLTKLHENLSKSNITIDKLQQTTSLPDLNKKPTKLHSVASIVQERITPNVNLEMSSEITFIDQKIHTLANISDKKNISKTGTLSQENIQTAGSDSLVQSEDHVEELSTSKLPSFHKSDIQQNNQEFPNLLNTISVKNSESDNEKVSIQKTHQINQKTNLQNKNDLSLQKSTDLLLSNDKNEIDNSLNDITDQPFQQNTEISMTSLDESLDILTKTFNKTKQILPSLKKIDEVSQHPESSINFHTKKSTLPIASPTVSFSKKATSKSGSTPISLIDDDDDDTSMITRTATTSTNLPKTDNDDDEQLRRSSLGLARDSLELLRNATPHHSSSTEQLTPYTNTDGTPHKRKSVLKSHFESSANLPTSELISYVAIDELKDDKNLMEKQIRRRSLTVGGGTIISCTSPKPTRDSLILLHERYSGSTTPHSGYNHLSNSDSKHVEFIREPGDTVTPALHIGRGTKSKHLSNRSISPSSSNDHLDASQRSKSETYPRRTSLDSVSRHRTPQTPLISTTTAPSFIDEEKICLNKNDYEEVVRLLMTPLSKKKQ